MTPDELIEKIKIYLQDLLIMVASDKWSGETLNKCLEDIKKI